MKVEIIVKGLNIELLHKLVTSFVAMLEAVGFEVPGFIVLK